MSQPKRWNYEPEELVKILSQVDGLLKDALEILEKFNRNVPPPCHMVDGVITFPFNEERSIPKTG